MVAALLLLLLLLDNATEGAEATLASASAGGGAPSWIAAVLLPLPLPLLPTVLLAAAWVQEEGPGQQGFLVQGCRRSCR